MPVIDNSVLIHGSPEEAFDDLCDHRAELELRSTERHVRAGGKRET